MSSALGGWVHGAQPHVNSDISGIGVVVAFLLSAYTTMALAFAAYFLGAIDIKLLGPVDILVHRVPMRSKISPAWQEACQQCILLFSDQQIMTGIAILIAGFVGLTGVMDVYHFQIVIMLAWMSSSVNLTALTVLGRYFEEHKAVFMWRLTGMMILLVLLLVALVPTASIHWAMWLTPDGDPKTTSGWAIPAGCFFVREWGQGFSPDAPFSYVLILISYAWKLGSVSKATRTLFLRHIRGPIEKYFETLANRAAQRYSAGTRRWNSWTYYVCMVLYIDLLVIFEFAASFAASLWISAIGLVYATTEIIIPRRQNAMHFAEEDEWRFGQIVPLILLLQPMGAMLELYRGGTLSKDLSETDMTPTEVTPPNLGSTHIHQLSIDPIIEIEPPNDQKQEAEAVVISMPVDAEEFSSLSEQRKVIYTSRLFAALIYLSHTCLFTFACLTFVVNAWSIGFSPTHDYFWLLLGTAAYIGLMLIVTLISVPLSKVFK